MKLKKKSLNNAGFSAIEVVLVVVVLVAVVGLGVFAFNSRSSSKNNENAASQNTSSSSDVSSNDVPDVADASGWARYGSGINVSGGRRLLFLTCNKGNSYKFVWGVTPQWGALHTKNRVFYQLYKGSKKVGGRHDGPNDWWYKNVTAKNVTLPKGVDHVKWGFGSYSSGNDKLQKHSC